MQLICNPVPQVSLPRWISAFNCASFPSVSGCSCATHTEQMGSKTSFFGDICGAGVSASTANESPARSLTEVGEGRNSSNFFTSRTAAAVVRPNHFVNLLGPSLFQKTTG